MLQIVSARLDRAALYTWLSTPPRLGSRIPAVHVADPSLHRHRHAVTPPCCRCTRACHPCWAARWTCRRIATRRKWVGRRCGRGQRLPAGGRVHCRQTGPPHSPLLCSGEALLAARTVPRVNVTCRLAATVHRGDGDGYDSLSQLWKPRRIFCVLDVEAGEQTVAGSGFV